MRNGTSYISSVRDNLGNEATFIKRGEYMLNNGIAYILPDGVLVAINGKAGIYPCTLGITEAVLDTNLTGGDPNALDLLM